MKVYYVEEFTPALIKGKKEMFVDKMAMGIAKSFEDAAIRYCATIKYTVPATGFDCSTAKNNKSIILTSQDLHLYVTEETLDF